MTSTTHHHAPTFPHHLGRKLVIGAAAVAVGVFGAFLVEDWTDNPSVTDSPTVVVDETPALPITPDAAERWIEGGVDETPMFPVTPDAAERWIEGGVDETPTFPVTPDAAERWIEDGS